MYNTEKDSRIIYLHEHDACDIINYDYYFCIIFRKRDGTHIHVYFLKYLFFL